jgi:hypothetical protein
MSFSSLGACVSMGLLARSQLDSWTTFPAFQAWRRAAVVVTATNTCEARKGYGMMVFGRVATAQKAQGLIPLNSVSRFKIQ